MWKKWEGRTVDGRFPLQQWLGGSDHSDVFLTQYGENGAQKAAIKLIPAENAGDKNLRDDAVLSSWSDAKKLSHPNLVRVLAWGRFQLDDVPLLYVVTEFAEENLAEILPMRALSPDEAQEILQPAAKALQTLHRAGFVHGRMKPSNIMAVGEMLKISTDGLNRNGDRGRTTSIYDAPEVTSTGVSPAADVWSLGATLLAVLTQKEPEVSGVPNAMLTEMPPSFPAIVRRCLQVDPRQRCTVNEILGEPEPAIAPPMTAQPPAAASLHAVAATEPVVVVSKPATVTPELLRADVPPQRPKRWMIVPIVVAILFVAALFGARFINHPKTVPAVEPQAANTIPAAQIPVTPVPAAPVAAKENPKPKADSRGSVERKVMPGVSQSSLRTIQGTVKVSIRVDVDPAGDVSQVKLTSPGSSKYFANLALAAARGWKFNAPQLNGQAVASTWTLRFRFKRTAVDASSEEERP
jgi:TonB family protein